MEVPLRRDSEFGLTAAQFAQMPDRLKKKASGLAGSDDPDQKAEAARLTADAAIWAQASKQLQAEGSDGKWSIVWAKVVKESEDLEESDDPDATPTVSLSQVGDWLVDFVEYGKRNNASDTSTIQSIHDSAKALGAMCEMESAESTVLEVDPGTPMTEMSFRESVWGDVAVTFAEADPQFDRANKEVWITPIRPGPGNARDGFYYPATTIREAVEAGMFNGVKMYANHPTKTGQKELPERDVRDWVGVIKETVWDDRRQRPRSRLRVLDDAIYDRFEAAPEHISFSVLGGGRARPGRVNGEDKKIVESMTKVRSVDWVTEAGAGGGIDFAESADEEFDMDLSQLTLAQVREGNPALYAAIREETEPAPEPEPKPEPEPEPVKGGGDKASAEAPAPEGFVPKDDYDALLARVEKMETKEAIAEAKIAASDIVNGRLAATVLTRPVREFIQSRFAEATVGDDMAFSDEASLAKAVDAEIAAVSKVAKPSVSRVTGAGGDAEDVHVPTMRESKEQAIDDRLGREVYPKARTDGEEGTPATAEPVKAGSWASQV